MSVQAFVVRLTFRGAFVVCLAGGGAGCSAEGAAPLGAGGTSVVAPTGGASGGGTNTGGSPNPTGGTQSFTGGASPVTSGGTPMATGGTSGGSAPTGGASGGTPGGGTADAGGAPAAGAGMAGGAGSPAGGAPSGGAAGSGNDIFLAPDGDDSNAGTEQAPFLTLSRAHEAASPGAIVWMLPGTYTYGSTMTLTKSGTEAAPIVISGTPGNRPLVDFASQPRGSNNRGIEIEGNYWQVRGIEVANAGDNGIAISGSHNVIENVVLHDCEDTGLQITVGTSLAGDDAYGADNLILNCDSYENFDQASGGENADGFAAKLRIGPGNVFRGCRAWNNADDGWDLFASNDVVVIEDSWAFSNGKVDGQNPQGDGNGFKLGGAPAGTDQGGAVHLVARNAAFENRACGFTRNNNPETIMASDCKVRDNPLGDFCAMSCSPQSGETMTAEQAKAAARNADGSLPPIE